MKTKAKLVVVIALIDNSGIVERNTTAVKVGEEPISAAEMNMYYIETINEFYNANANYLAMYTAKYLHLTINNTNLTILL